MKTTHVQHPLRQTSDVIHFITGLLRMQQPPDSGHGDRQLRLATSFSVLFCFTGTVSFCPGWMDCRRSR